MNKKRLFISLLAIITVVGAIVGSYVYRDTIYSRIARTAAVVSGQEIKPLLDSESRYIRQIAQAVPLCGSLIVVNLMLS